MARKKRDYRAEELRRNELSRQRGYRNRAHERRSKLVDRELRAQEWSIIHAYSAPLRYDYKNNNPHHLSRERYLRAYERLMNSDDFRYTPDGRMQLSDSPEFEDWLVDVVDFMTEADFDERYSRGSQW